MKLTAFGAVVGDKESGSFGLSVHKTLEEAVTAFEQENGGEEGDDAAAAAGGQSCMFASVYETPFEDQDAAVSHVFRNIPRLFFQSTLSPTLARVWTRTPHPETLVLRHVIPRHRASHIDISRFLCIFTYMFTVSSPHRVCGGS